ncbi:hypothetical protein B0T17DRAFT_612803 [Bombardia bombarda]|uniref:Uncharacterized protein n=1 Tax=Bombardia bombarda TaxID=252184 RepID=A0AA39XLU7_9PEZI|nr:hypothetical protein B0T17DRAFT_612803 [Bombardia bombarda]
MENWVGDVIAACVYAVVHAAVPSNIFAIYGNGEEKELTDLVPSIFNQLGPDSLASLRRLTPPTASLLKRAYRERPAYIMVEVEKWVGDVIAARRDAVSELDIKVPEAKAKETEIKEA